MVDAIPEMARLVLRHVRSLSPIVAVIAISQVLLFREVPADLGAKVVGLLLILIGMTFFVQGLETSLFPLAEELTETIARRGRIGVLLGFAFCIGFGSTVAEPALVAFVAQALPVMAPDREPAEAMRLAATLRYAVAAGVGVSLVLSCLRIVMGWPAWWLVLGGYGVAAVLASTTATPLAGVAFDAGVAATSAINVPLIAAIGVGLATVLRARSPLVDGFGLVALASLMPMLTLLVGAAVLG